MSTETFNYRNYRKYKSIENIRGKAREDARNRYNDYLLFNEFTDGGNPCTFKQFLGHILHLAHTKNICLTPNQAKHVHMFNTFQNSESKEKLTHEESDDSDSSSEVIPASKFTITHRTVGCDTSTQEVTIMPHVIQRASSLPEREGTTQTVQTRTGIGLKRVAGPLFLLTLLSLTSPAKADTNSIDILHITIKIVTLITSLIRITKIIHYIRTHSFKDWINSLKNTPKHPPSQQEDITPQHYTKEQAEQLKINLESEERKTDALHTIRKRRIDAYSQEIEAIKSSMELQDIKLLDKTRKTNTNPLDVKKLIAHIQFNVTSSRIDNKFLAKVHNQAKNYFSTHHIDDPTIQVAMFEEARDTFLHSHKYHDQSLDFDSIKVLSEKSQLNGIFYRNYYCRKMHQWFGFDNVIHPTLNPFKLFLDIKSTYITIE